MELSKTNYGNRKQQRDVGGAGDKSTLKPPETTKEKRRELAKKDIVSSDSDDDSCDGNDDPSLPKSSTKKRAGEKDTTRSKKKFNPGTPEVIHVPTTDDAATALIALSAPKLSEPLTTPKKQTRILTQIFLLPHSDTPYFSPDQIYPSISCMVPRNATVRSSFGEIGVYSDSSLPEIAFEAIQDALRVERLTSMFQLGEGIFWYDPVASSKIYFANIFISEIQGNFLFVARTKGNKVNLLPLDRDEYFHHAIESNKSSPLELAWTCLPAEAVQVQPPQTLTKRPKSHACNEIRAASEDDVIERDYILILHLGMTSVKGNQEPMKTSITIRTDSTGTPLNAATITLDTLNGAIDNSLPRHLERSSRALYLLHSDRKGNLAKDVVLAQNNADLISAWQEVAGACAIRIAVDIKSPSDAPSSSSSKSSGKPWHPFGTIAASSSSAASAGITSRDVAGMVTALWESNGWPTTGIKQEQAIRYHTHQVMHNRTALEEAERSGIVSFIPSKWIAFDPTTATSIRGLPLTSSSQPVMYGQAQQVILPPSQAPVVAAPVQAAAAATTGCSAAAEFSIFLKNVQLSHREQGLREAGYVEVDDLKEASDEELRGHLELVDIRRLRRHMNQQSGN